MPGQTVQTQIRLHRFDSLHYGRVTVQILESLKQIFWVSEYLGNLRYHYFHNDPKFLDRQVWANSVDSDQEQSDQGLHCLPFCLHLLDALLYGNYKTLMFKF